MRSDGDGSGGVTQTPSPPTVAVVLPTRGLVHSRTVESVQVALSRAAEAGVVRPAPAPWCFAHGLPIPESHEAATEAAMATGADLLWFIEDDNQIPPDALTASVEQMRAGGRAVVAVDYPIGRDGTRWDAIYREAGEILFCGLGITLIEREVFERLERPWFSLDRWYGRICERCGRQRSRRIAERCVCPEGTPSRLALVEEKFPRNVGGVDVAFFIRVRDAGFAIDYVRRNAGTSQPMVGGQFRVRRLGAESGSGVNDRPHQVEVWDTIDQPQYYFRAQDSDRFDHRAQLTEWTVGFRARSPWQTQFWLGSRSFGGTYDAVHDERIVAAREAFPEANRVLELGSLEGGHTLAISRWADHVTGIEGRGANIEKASWILGLHGATNAELHQADLETDELAVFGPFDLCIAVGVLYHVPDPLDLLDRIARSAPDLFLWTHVAPGDEPMTYAEAGLADPLSGLSPTSTWLPRAALLEALRERWAEVKVLADEADPPALRPRAHHGPGPALTVVARGARTQPKATKRLPVRNKATVSA